VTRKNRAKQAARRRQDATGEPYLRALAAVRADESSGTSGAGRVVSTDDDPLVMPWCCGDEPPQCPVGWHLEQWVTVPETLVDRYCDGDWEEVDGDTAPTWDELADAWRSYYEYVESAGLDPLGEMNVAESDTRRERWTFAVVDTSDGIALEGARIADSPEEPDVLPLDVRAYLQVLDDGAMDLPWATTAEMAAAIATQPSSGDELTVDDAEAGRLTGTFTLTRTAPRDVSVVQHERRLRARKALDRR
jgi:hypothetical protein